MRRIRSRLPKPPKAITCIASRSSFVPPSCARISARPKPLGSAASFHRIENNGCLCVGRWSDEECGLRPYPLRLSKLGVNRVVFLEALLKPDSPAIITLAEEDILSAPERGPVEVGYVPEERRRLLAATGVAYSLASSRADRL